MKLVIEIERRSKMKNNAVINELITESQGDLADRMREAFDKGYEQGLDDAWEAARKIMRMNIVEKNAIFGEIGRMTYSVILDLSASEVITKIREYEERKKQDDEIKVGDEVIYDGMKGIVSRGIYHIGSDAEEFVTIWLGNHMASCSVKNIKPTGKNNSQFVEMLKQLQEGAE